MFALLGPAPRSRRYARRARRSSRAAATVALRARRIRLRPRRARSCTTSSFEIPAGKTVAVVGPSAARASRRSSRLLFRFYDVQQGAHLASTARTSATSRRSRCARRSASCRRTRCCSTTPSTTTSPTAARAPAADEVEAAARAAHIHDFIAATPDGYDDDGGRARPEAVGRREAARRDRAHAAEEPADPDLRRGDVGARLGQRARDPGASCRKSRSSARRWSSRTGCRPWSTRTRSWCWTTAASSSAARTPS